MAIIGNIIYKSYYLVLLVGNIGTGKTTFRNKLEKKRKGRFFVCPGKYKGGDDVEQGIRMNEEIEDGLNRGLTVIVDGPHIKCKDRNEILGFAKRANCKSIIFDFGSGNDESLNRRANLNLEYPYEEWKKMHEDNKRTYEQPNYEIDNYDKIIRIKTY